MTWSTPITVGTILQDVTLLQMLVAASNERGIALNGSGWTQLPAPSAGDQLNARAFWTALQGAVAIGLDSGNGGWANHSLTFQGNAAPNLFSANAGWTYPTIRAAAALPPPVGPGSTLAPLYWYTFTGSGPSTRIAAQDADILFARLRPREILSTSAMYDTQGNAADSGQVALLVADAPEDGDAPVGFPDYGSEGKLYYCTSAGNWILTSGVRPDTLDNTQLAPNSIAESNALYDFGGIGQVRYGDYLGAHLFEEIRCILDLERWTWGDMQEAQIGGAYVVDISGLAGGGFAPTQLNEGTTVYGLGSTPSDPVLANAEANAAAVYVVSTYAGGTLPLPFAFYQTTFDGTDYACSAQRGDVTLQASWGNTTIARKYALYCYAVTVAPGGPPATIWDANGDPVLDARWNQFYAAGPITVATTGLPALGNGTVIPDPPPAPGAGLANYQGYQIMDIAMLTQWNTTGGFQYCTATV